MTQPPLTSSTPTNNLNHPGSGFTFYSNADNITDSTAAFTNELASSTDINGDTTETIEETIANSGISVPWRHLVRIVRLNFSLFFTPVATNHIGDGSEKSLGIGCS